MDLAERRFGRWTAVRKNPDGTHLCRCDCGNESDVPENWLLSGFSTSCGCRKGRAKDLRLRSFGHLTAIEPVAEKDQDNSIRWRCLCKCGGETVVSSNKLLKGHTTSCGCRKLTGAQEAKTYVNGSCLEVLFSPKLRTNNTSGHTGVHKKRNKWVSYINVGGVFYWLGSYGNFEDAVAARETAEIEWKEKLAGQV